MHDIGCHALGGVTYFLGEPKLRTRKQKENESQVRLAKSNDSIFLPLPFRKGVLSTGAKKGEGGGERSDPRKYGHPMSIFSWDLISLFGFLLKTTE